MSAVHHGPHADPRRFTADDPRVEKIPECGCWIWMGVVGKAGYGRASMGSGPKVLAHRAFYEAMHGTIPDGLTLDHRCRVRSCVNPAHLHPCTQRENNFASGARTIGAVNAAKERCPRCGADFTVNKYGRYCKPCRRTQINDWKRAEYRNNPVYREKVLAANRARVARG